MAQSFLSTKRIPTILGIIILAAGLVGGIFLANSVTTGFLPRASPETTPKNLKITNVTDTSFTVSWVTDNKTTGYVKYGSSAGAISTVVTDDRDQISGSVGQYKTHHVTLRGLSPTSTPGTGTTEVSSLLISASFSSTAGVSGATDSATGVVDDEGALSATTGSGSTTAGDSVAVVTGGVVVDSTEVDVVVFWGTCCSSEAKTSSKFAVPCGAESDDDGVFLSSDITVCSTVTNFY